MKSAKALLACLVLVVCICAYGPASAQEPKQEEVRALVIPVTETVDFGLESFITRALENHKGIPFVILDIETYGGHLEAAFEISEILTDLDSGTKTIAYIRNKALSAGALIAMSCDEIVMRKDSTFGDCAPVSMGGHGAGPEILDEKIQSPLRAVFRKLAVKNGYPEKPAEAMVTKEMEIYLVTYLDGGQKFLTKTEMDALSAPQLEQIKEQKIIVEADRLLTLHSQEAFDMGFARHITNDIEDLKELYSIDSFEVLTQNWDERLVRFLIAISPILMTLGLLGIWIEIRTPGFGLPGLFGIACIALVMAGKYMIGLSNHTEILIFLSGFLLLGVEIFVIPGFGFTGIIGILLILTGFYLMSVPFVIPKTSWELESLYAVCREFVLTVAAAGVGAGIIGYFLPKTHWARKHIFLSRSERAEDGFVANTPAQIAIGAQARAATALRPAGKIRFNDRLLDAIADGEFVENGCAVEVVRTEGGKITVRRV